MTGFGKAECVAAGNKYTVEIRSVNGKNCDITIKTSIIPREKEMEVRQYILSQLNRGSIDLFINAENVEGSSSRSINSALLKDYYGKIKEAVKGTDFVGINDSYILSTVLRMPDVVESKKTEFTEDDWEVLYGAIKEAVDGLNAFREKEGVSLRADVLSKVDLIESYVPEVEKYEKERIEAVRSRILQRIEELQLQPDMNRLEQEIIYYLEKLDVNEEKVRLRQHCRYFRETIDNEQYPGKKLGFIAQEMGREINTLGSKANHAEIQKWVVRMKDELEKIKEQSLNIL
ncbi:MAG: YicC family protein [Bacteroidales bacterium]|nr:YicC family protein [Bacteroidales bacterium]